MKYGLVLSGGGSKGAYESGCMKALQELGYHFDIVTGTSIGALNGLLVAQEDYQKLYELWDTLSLEKVLKHPCVIILAVHTVIFFRWRKPWSAFITHGKRKNLRKN